ncbi:MAG: putative baseplate assembly protein [Gammaproteobacteria bacterium]|nr:putative baseplate assembly protein [Gammaproteobacteria bacterium]
MTTIAITQREKRVQAIRESGTLNGIDYLEVISEDQLTLVVHFIAPLPGQTDGVPTSPALIEENVRIDGGVRIKNICVMSQAASGNEWTLTVDQPGDFSTYTLSIVTSPFEESHPAGFDPLLCDISFSFKVSCPSEFDCKSPGVSSEQQDETLTPDYLAKDYNGFRRLMLERLSSLMPNWKERNPGDITVMLTELLGYQADKLSYYQDSVTTETYLGTARQRASLRRHARLLDYTMHEGCNGRTWIQLKITPGGDLDGKVLPLGTPLVSSSDTSSRPTIHPDDMDAKVVSSAIVFETMHDQPVYSGHNEIELYTWSDSVTGLPKGSTVFTLVNDPPLALVVGDVVVLEEVRSPQTGALADADPGKRHAMRIVATTPESDPLTGQSVLTVTGHSQDALPFDMCISVEVDYEGSPQKLATSRAFGNMILADHGRSVSDPSVLSPAQVPYDRVYAPRLSVPTITYAQVYTHHENLETPVTGMLKQDPRKAHAAVWLDDGVSTWVVQKDLLGSDRFAKEFVVEPNRDRSVLIRFGDSVHGNTPSPGVTFSPRYRVGNGRAGNVGANGISKIITNYQGISEVRNPIAAMGGVEPETMADVRRYAPQAYRTQKRAVVEEDYETVAQLYPEVQRARAQFRWTGSWYTVFITIDRFEGRAVSGDRDFVDKLIQHIEAYRIAGYDIKICDPLFIPLDITLRICCHPGYSPPDVKENLLDVFGPSFTKTGEKGFFHPDRHTFGTPLYLSTLYTTALSVTGVASAQALRFQRWDQIAHNELEDGLFQPSNMEIIRCDTDPNYPENGRITFDVYGAT